MGSTRPPDGRALLWRLVLSEGAGLGTALVAALGLTIVDLYLTGHNLGTITRPFLQWPAAGVHLSLADVLILIVAGVAAAVMLRATRGGGGQAMEVGECGQAWRAARIR